MFDPHMAFFQLIVNYYDLHRLMLNHSLQNNHHNVQIHIYAISCIGDLGWVLKLTSNLRGYPDGQRTTMNLNLHPMFVLCPQLAQVS